MKNWIRLALSLSMITVFYNIVEGLISVYLGNKDETLALFGFGLDSFVEVISGIGIWHMVLRIRRHGEEKRDHFEKRALKITGTAFYILTMGLLIAAVLNIYTGHQPETTFWGVVIALISISTMWWLIRQKNKVGRALNSDAIIADANCTKTCLQLSIILLVSSVSFELTGISSIDAIGSLFIAGLSYREGKESFEKAGNQNSCSCD